MKKNIAAIVAFSLVLLGLSPLTHGAGFLIYEHGAAAMAMGGAFVAVADNPTAIFHNPAGIAWLDGTQISFGTTLIIPSYSLSLPNWPDPTFQSIDTESKLFYPSTFYISHKLSDRIVAGFGFFSPYGLGLEWPADYPLRYISTKDDMKTFIFNPTVAVKLSETLSAGVGVSYVYSTIEFKRVNVVDLTLVGGGTPDALVTVEGKGSAWGLNAGALYKGENFSLGVNWRGGFDLEFEGDLEVDTSNIPAPFLPFVPATGDVSTIFSFPHIFGLGLAFNLTEKLMLTADVHYILWSSYDKFEIIVDYSDPFPDPEPEEFPEDWEDSYVLRGGLQYAVNENFALRAGVLYDKTPQPIETMDPILPDANRWALTGGFGYKSGNFVIDVAYQLEFFADRTSPNREIPAYQVGPVNLGEGTYSTTAHLIGVSFGFIF